MKYPWSIFMTLKKLTNKSLIIFTFLFLVSTVLIAGEIQTGAERTSDYLPYLKNKRVGIVANQTTIIGGKNLVDSLLALGVNVKKVLCPEHGFRGEASAGEIIENDTDAVTRLPIISIYRSDTRTERNKPTPSDLEGLDILLFDLQDVGMRFFTNISTLHYVMEACAENNVELMLLDRPNPHGFYVDGPVLDTAFKSFVGMHPVPVVHGMTMGEYATMLNGEQWLKNRVQCNLKIIKCGNYTHNSLYNLPVKPSPNLPNMQAIYLYPSVCLFEGTVFSLGRGTDFPFQVYGHPSLTQLEFSFTPHSTRSSTNPPLRDRKCFGYDLRNYDIKKIVQSKKINLDWLIDAYRTFAQKDSFFIPYINTLSGSRRIQEQIKKGMNANEIRSTWKNELAAFKVVRKKYLLYTDFE